MLARHIILRLAESQDSPCRGGIQRETSKRTLPSRLTRTHAVSRPALPWHRPYRSCIDFTTRATRSKRSRLVLVLIPHQFISRLLFLTLLHAHYCASYSSDASNTTNKACQALALALVQYRNRRGSTQDQGGENLEPTTALSNLRYIPALW